MTVCKIVFVVKDGTNYYKVKFLCTAEVRSASKSHPLTRHYTVTVDDAGIETTHRTTKNPTIVSAQHFITKHLKQVQCIS